MSSCSPTSRIGERSRKIAMRADRNGLLYVMDRTNGEVLSAAPFGYVNSNRGVDMKTGRLIPVEEKTPRQGVVVRDICPAAPGMKDWQPTSFSPRTGLLYIPHQNLCEDIEAMTTSYIAGTPFVGASVVYKAGPGRPSRSGHGLGSGRRQGGVGGEGDVPGVERHRRHGRRRRVLRDHGRLVQGRAREDRRAAMAVQVRLRASSASRSSTRGPTAASTWRCCRASAAGPGRSSATISTRAMRPPATDSAACSRT